MLPLLLAQATEKRATKPNKKGRQFFFTGILWLMEGGRKRENRPIGVNRTKEIAHAHARGYTISATRLIEVFL